MAVVKLFKVVIDSPLGYQTFNQFADNNADLRTQMFVEHGEREGLTPRTVSAPSGFDFRKLGRHDIVEIPRTVGVAATYIVPPADLGIALSWGGPAIEGVWKWATGAYWLKVVGLTSWWCEATAIGGSTTTYLPPQTREQFPTAANPSAGVWVTTYSLVAGAFVPANMSFTFAIYGEPG